MPRRRTKKTRLVYCEGASDKAFLDCLKPLYATKTRSIDIKRGTGGDQVHLVEEAVKKGRAYDDTFLKIDGDRNAQEMTDAEQIANDNEVIVLKTIPCIELLLISILEPGKRTASWNSTRLKAYFESEYIPRNKRTNVREYKSRFTKPIIESARIRLPELQVLIDMF